MTGLQDAKSLIASWHRDLDCGEETDAGHMCDAYHAEPFCWRGVHPFGECAGARSLYTRFWGPLKAALRHMQRRDDIFFAGTNEIDGGNSVWVVSMGHLAGLFDAPWLGICPSGKMAFLRYCCFHKVVGHKITEIMLHVDIPGLMAQAGQNPFRQETGAHLLHRGPLHQGGLLLERQCAREGEKTLAAINRMRENLGTWNSGLALPVELALDWQENMVWWGPCGIGATCTIERYARQHAGPFRAGFSHRSATQHRVRCAEGHFGGFFGWPNFTARSRGGFQGMAAHDRDLEFRVIDIYRREGDKLAENWVFIDFLWLWKQTGVDLLANTGRGVPGQG